MRVGKTEQGEEDWCLAKSGRQNVNIALQLPTLKARASHLQGNRLHWLWLPTSWWDWDAAETWRMQERAAPPFKKRKMPKDGTEAETGLQAEALSVGGYCWKEGLPHAVGVWACSVEGNEGYEICMWMRATPPQGRKSNKRYLGP